jgi:signal transduction histidine kinase
MTSGNTNSAGRLERHLTGGLIVVALLSAMLGAAISLRMSGRTAANADAVVDALADAISRNVQTQPLLDAFVRAGSAKAATVYGPNGATLATSGTPSPDVEQVFRSLPGGGSLSVEPGVPSSGTSSRNALIAALTAAAASLLLALVASSIVGRGVRRRLEAIRADVHETNDAAQKREVGLRRRITELESMNKDLESFAATVSHDLRAPVGSISGFAQALDEDYASKLDDVGRECIYWIRHSANQMLNLIEGMLQMARLTRVEVHRTDVDISSMAREIAEGLQRAHPDRAVEFVIPQGIIASGDERLLRAVLDNLIGNAFKFTSKRPGARIEIGARDDEGTPAFFVRDNGAGFAPEHAAKMFRPFQRLHSEKEFSGTGIGLATVHRIVQRHGGRVWAEGEPEKGATVYFTTGTAEEWAA